METLLEKLENAIKVCEETKNPETTITLDYSELLLLKRYEEVSDFDMRLAKESLRRACNFY